MESESGVVIHMFETPAVRRAHLDRLRPPQLAAPSTQPRQCLGGLSETTLAKSIGSRRAVPGCLHARQATCTRTRKHPGGRYFQSEYILLRAQRAGAPITYENKTASASRCLSIGDDRAWLRKPRFRTARLGREHQYRTSPKPATLLRLSPISTSRRWLLSRASHKPEHHSRKQCRGRAEA